MTQTAEVEVSTAATKTTIRPDTTKMVVGKAPSGGKSYHADDAVGHALAGLTIVSVKALAVQYGIETADYEHLNVGQQRMAIGAKFRKILKDEPVKEEGLKAAADELRSTQEPAPKKSRAKKAKAAVETAGAEGGEANDPAE